MVDQSDSNSILEDRAFGCILGAFVGDALGTYLEFKFGLIKDAEVERAMSMKGGGPFSLAPGQVTDDSELAMMCLNGLVAGNGSLDTFKLCQFYAKWFTSVPFDMGNTTREGLKYCRSGNPNLVYEKTKVGLGSRSHSNGSLMRITPLAVWCHKLTQAEIERAVPLDVRFIHHNTVVETVCIGYCLAIKHLLTDPTDPERRFKAFEVCYEYCKREKEVSSWLDECRTLKIKFTDL
jgi:ADP-ribosyl-[dinitrogen reductase] hydrolase